MFKILLASLILSSCVFQSAPMPYSFSQVERREMQELHKKAVRIDWVCGFEAKGRMGSGVVVGHKNGKTQIATAEHVTAAILGRDCDIVVRDWWGLSGFAELVASDEDTDIAVLEVSETLGEVAGLSNPFLGQSVTCIGWPVLPHKEYFGKSVTKGSVSTIVGDYLRVSADLYFGNSGGSCFSRDGEVVGIVSYFIAGGNFLGQTVPFPGQYFIVHVKNLKKLLD